MSDDFLRSLNEQVSGTSYQHLLEAYNKLLNEQEPAPAFQSDPMGAEVIGQGMNPNGDPDSNVSPNRGEEGMNAQGIQLTGEQISQINQDLQGIEQAMQRIRSILGDQPEQQQEAPANMISRYMHRR